LDDKSLSINNKTNLNHIKELKNKNPNENNKEKENVSQVNITTNIDNSKEKVKNTIFVNKLNAVITKYG